LTGIKIDQSLIAAMENRKEDMGLVKSVIDIAHTLGRLVVAEGVETGGDLDNGFQFGM